MLAAEIKKSVDIKTKNDKSNTSLDFHALNESKQYKHAVCNNQVFYLALCPSLNFKCPS